MRYFILFFVFFTSCKSKDETIKDADLKHLDTLIEKSKKISDSAYEMNKLADEKTKNIVKNTIEKVNQLEQNNSTLKSQVNSLKKMPVKTNTITIKDTIYITEKRNFWGKKKIKVDSVSSETVVEDTITNDY